MAGSVNKVTLIRNLGKDPEVRTTQAGQQDRQLYPGNQRNLERPDFGRAEGTDGMAPGRDLQ